MAIFAVSDVVFDTDMANPIYSARSARKALHISQTRACVNDFAVNVARA